LQITTRALGGSLSLTVMTLTIPITGVRCARCAMTGIRLRHRLLAGPNDGAHAPAGAREFIFIFRRANRKKILENFRNSGKVISRFL